MAADEILLEEAGRSGHAILRFYQWDRPSVSIGYLQDHAAAPAGYAVVRRPTGGGVVFHDHDLTYTAAIPAGHWLTAVDRTASYGQVNGAVMAGLAAAGITAELTDAEIAASTDRRHMVCFTNPTRYDIVAGGRKIAGAAQRRLRTGIIHQGSIHFGTPLPLPRPRLIDCIVQGFAEKLRVGFCPFEAGSDLATRISRLAAARYATDQWNRKR